jgi:outer membrane protein
MKISTFFLILLFYLYSGNLSAEIFYVDIDKIINQTNVGKHINEEFKKSKKINDTKNLESKDLLKKRENSLISQKNILEVNEFNNRLRLFRKDVNDFNQLSQKSNRDLQNTLMKNKANFLQLIEPILLDYVSTNNITYLLQKKYIIVGHNDLNKTADIIELVDKKINISDFNDSISK